MIKTWWGNLVDNYTCSWSEDLQQNCDSPWEASRQTSALQRRRWEGVGRGWCSPDQRYTYPGALVTQYPPPWENIANQINREKPCLIFVQVHCKTKTLTIDLKQGKDNVIVFFLPILGSFCVFRPILCYVAKSVENMTSESNQSILCDEFLYQGSEQQLLVVCCETATGKVRLVKISFAAAFAESGSY